MATFQTASLLNIIEQGQKIESVFVGVLLETAMKLSSITDANILVVVDTSHGRKWVGRRSLKEEFVEGRLRVGSKDEEIVVDGVPNNDPSVASFGEELIMGGLNLTASSAPTADVEAITKSATKSSPAPSTPINFATADSANRQSSANLSAPLTVKTSPMANESMVDEPASSSATSVSMDSAFKENNFNATKLVGSQKRKRRASQTSMQEKKLRCESVEREGIRENEAFRKEPEVDPEGSSMTEASTVNATGFLEDVARKFPSGAAGGHAHFLESQRQQESPSSDAELTDLFTDGTNNNNNNNDYDSKKIFGKSSSTASEIARKDRSFSSPLGQTSGEGSFIRHASPSPAVENFEGLEPDAATLGANFFQEQIRTMLRADMTIEEISFHLKVPPSIVNYWTQLMSAMPPVKDGEPTSDKMPGKSLPANNNYGHPLIGGPSEDAMAKSTPGRRSGKLDKHSLKQLIDSNKSIREIADILGVHPTTVYRAMKAYDLSLPGHNTTPTGGGGKGTGPNSSSKPPMALTQFANVESQQRHNEDGTPTAPPTGQRVRLKKDRLQLLRTLILSGATVRECANILGVHHTTIYRAMRNLNIDPQAAQHPKAPAAGSASTSITPPGISADLAAEMAAGSSLLQHFPSLADASQMRRWMDPAAAAAAAAANYMGMGSLADVYNQAAFRDLAPTTAAASSRGSGLDYLASFPPRAAGGDEEDLNEDLLEQEFEREVRRESPAIDQDQSKMGGEDKAGETENQTAETQSDD